MAHNTSSYSEVLTTQEIRRVTTDLLTVNPAMTKSDVLTVLEELALLAESAMLFQGIISGDLEVVGLEDGSIKVKASDRQRRLLH